MDTPLLALTRPGRDPLPDAFPRAAEAENMRQLIQLRWLAVGGQLVAILLAHFGFGVPLPVVPMLGLVGLLALANMLFTLTLRRLWIARGELLGALLLDMAVLTAQFYLSGGATNPFVSLYLLQVVLGAILLPPLLAWLLVLMAAGCLALLNLSHLPLRFPPRFGPFEADLRLIGEWISFAMVAVLLALFIARITRNLQARDALAAQLAQRAAEEDGIVRMGLFASGAAHELGTPLSSLSVLIADWRRNPVVARDPRLREELAEVEAELQRCKAIVSNILHAAGRTRGEAMGVTGARAMLEEVAGAWREARGAASLRFDCTRLGSETIAAEPSLRQAIWSLLENAAQASPHGIALAGEATGGELVISVLDRGPGFSPGELARVGQLHQSSKGPGRGLGLFLAGNLARRLGGRLDAANREGGGAVVRLLLPLASPHT